MAPLPVIPNVVRFVWTFTSGGPPVHNVLHVRSLTGTPAQMSLALNNALNANPNTFKAMSTAYIQNTWDFTPLDGVSARSSVTTSSHPGIQTGDVIVGQAQVISMQTGLRGPRHRGRLYLGPLAEAVQVDGRITSAVNSDVVTAWAAVQAALTANSPSCELVVASYKHADANRVTFFRADSVCGSVRSRLKQLR